MNDRLDAVLEREVPELEQAVFGCAEQVACGVGLGVDCGRGRCAVSVLDVAGCLDQGDGGDSVAVTAQTEETGFRDQVPQDDVGVKTGAGDPQALWIKGECDDGFLVAIEGDRCGVGLCGPQSNAAVLVADGEGVWVGGRPGEGGDFGAVSDLVPGGERRTPAHVPDEHILESKGRTPSLCLGRGSSWMMPNRPGQRPRLARGEGKSAPLCLCVARSEQGAGKIKAKLRPACSEMVSARKVKKARSKLRCAAGFPVAGTSQKFWNKQARRKKKAGRGAAAALCECESGGGKARQADEPTLRPASVARFQGPFPSPIASHRIHHVVSYRIASHPSHPRLRARHRLSSGSWPYSLDTRTGASKHHSSRAISTQPTTPRTPLRPASTAATPRTSRASASLHDNTAESLDPHLRPRHHLAASQSIADDCIAGFTPTFSRHTHSFHSFLACFTPILRSDLPLLRQRACYGSCSCRYARRDSASLRERASFHRRSPRADLPALLPLPTGATTAAAINEPSQHVFTATDLPDIPDEVLTLEPAPIPGADSAAAAIPPAVDSDVHVQVQDADMDPEQGMDEYRTAAAAPLPSMLNSNAIPLEEDASGDLSASSNEALTLTSTVSRGNYHQCGSARRVKVYELKGEVWFDRGTGYCAGVYDETVDEALLVARREEKCQFLEGIDVPPDAEVDENDAVLQMPPATMHSPSRRPCSLSHANSSSSSAKT
ncbi:hypothetical protein L1887_49930 [Cichorium endivia]|nr:hypothetical protein L1887_49930 [Cichorium endivia]